MPRYRLLLIFLVVLLRPPALANPTKKFVGDFRAMYTAPAATNNVAIQFIIDKPQGVLALAAADVTIGILKGSRLQSSLDPGQTLKITPIPGGHLLVQIVGDDRSPTLPTHDIRFRITIERANVKALRLSNPRWGDSDPTAGHDFSALGPATIPGAKFVLDPMYVAFNDLSDLHMTIQNLEFAHNLSEAELNLIDLEALFDRPLDLLLPQFTLSPGTSSEDLGLLFHAGPEPDPELFLVAMGQIVDPARGEKVGSFVHAVQGIPEAHTLLLAPAMVLAFLSVLSRRRRIG